MLTDCLLVPDKDLYLETQVIPVISIRNFSRTTRKDSEKTVIMHYFKNYTFLIRYRAEVNKGMTAQLFDLFTRTTLFFFT